jgi:hypothetical protein
MCFITFKNDNFFGFFIDIKQKSLSIFTIYDNSPLLKNTESEKITSHPLILSEYETK